MSFAKTFWVTSSASWRSRTIPRTYEQTSSEKRT